MVPLSPASPWGTLYVDKGVKMKFTKGHIPWSKGKRGLFKQTEATKLLMSKQRIGHPNYYKGKKVKVKCLKCGKEFNVHPCDIKNGRGKYYSKRCYNASSACLIKKGIKLFEGRKHKPESLIKIGKKTSEREPWNKGKVMLFMGKNSPYYKNGNSPIKRRIRASSRYEQWRQQVFIRDDFTCRKCGKRGGILNAHHSKKTFSQLLLEVKENLPLLELYDAVMIYSPFWDIDNGETFCEKCHIAEHKKRRKNG